MESQKPNSQPNEIDLAYLFSRIGAFFTSLGSALVSLLALARRTPLENKGIFAAAIVISLAAGLGYRVFLDAKYFETSMILSCNYLNKRLVDNTVQKLNQLAAQSDRSGLAKELNISDSLAKKLLKFDAKPFVAERDVIELEVLKEQLKSVQAASRNEQVIEQVLNRIEIENRHAFELTIRTSSPTAVSELQGAIVNYLRTKDYIKRRVEVTRENLLAKRNKLMRDLAKLDSLKIIIYDNYKSMADQARQGSNNVILSDKSVTDPVEIYGEDRRIYDQLQIVNYDIYLQPDFEIVDGFAEYDEPASLSLRAAMVISLLVGVALGYVIVALVSLNRYLESVK